MLLVEVHSSLTLGVLTLPYVCKLCGLALGLLMLVAGYVATLWSFYMIIKSNHKTGGKRGHKSFKELYVACGGEKLYLGYNIAVMFTVSGTLLGYQIISLLSF